MILDFTIDQDDGVILLTNPDLLIGLDASGNQSNKFKGMQPLGIWWKGSDNNAGSLSFHGFGRFTTTLLEKNRQLGQIAKTRQRMNPENGSYCFIVDHESRITVEKTIFLSQNKNSLHSALAIFNPDELDLSLSFEFIPCFDLPDDKKSSFTFKPWGSIINDNRHIVHYIDDNHHEMFRIDLSFTGPIVPQCSGTRQHFCLPLGVAKEYRNIHFRLDVTANDGSSSPQFLHFEEELSINRSFWSQRLNESSIQLIDDNDDFGNSWNISRFILTSGSGRIDRRIHSCSSSPSSNLTLSRLDYILAGCKTFQEFECNIDDNDLLNCTRDAMIRYEKEQQKQIDKDIFLLDLTQILLCFETIATYHPDRSFDSDPLKSLHKQIAEFAISIYEEPFAEDKTKNDCSTLWMRMIRYLCIAHCLTAYSRVDRGKKRNTALLQPLTNHLKTIKHDLTLFLDSPLRKEETPVPEHVLLFIELYRLLSGSKTSLKRILLSLSGTILSEEKNHSSNAFTSLSPLFVLRISRQLLVEQEIATAMKLFRASHQKAASLLFRLQGESGLLTTADIQAENAAAAIINVITDAICHCDGDRIFIFQGFETLYNCSIKQHLPWDLLFETEIKKGKIAFLQLSRQYPSKEPIERLLYLKEGFCSAEMIEKVSRRIVSRRDGLIGLSLSFNDYFELS